MSEVAEKTEAEAPVIDDGSKLVDETSILEKAREFVAEIKAAIAVEKKRAGIYAKAALAKAETRALALASDGMPDWTGATAAYRYAVQDMMADAFKSCSPALRSTVDNSLKSALRRGVLDGVIVRWVRENIEGLDKVEEGKEKDSPAFRKAMRTQYERAAKLKLANPIAVPDHWKDVQPDDLSVEAKTENTAAEKVSIAALAIAEMTAAEALASVHEILSGILVPACEPNAKVVGGRVTAANALAPIIGQAQAGFKLLGDSNLTGEALAEVRASFEKFSYKA